MTQSFPQIPGVPVRRIHHLGVAVRSLAEARPLYESFLGMPLQHTEQLANGQIEVAFVKVGESRIELIEPKSAEHPVARWMSEHGPGLHHVALEVDDVAAALEAARAAGMKLVDQQPRAGSRGTIVAYVDPGSTHGALIQFVQNV